MTAIGQRQSDFEATRVANRTYASRISRGPLSMRLDSATVVGLLICVLTLIPARLILPGFGDRPVYILGVLMFVWWLVSRMAPHLTMPGPQPIRWAILAYALTILMSYAVAQLRLLTSIEANGADRAMLYFACFAGIALVTADGIATESRLDQVIRVFVFCGAVMAVIAVIQFAFSYDATTLIQIPGLVAKWEAIGFEARGAAIRVASTTTHYIELATVLATILPFAIHLAMFARRRRWIPIAISLLLMAGVMTTVSRSGVLAVAIVAVLLIPTWNWRFRYNVFVMLGLLMAGLAAAKPSLMRTLTSLFEDPSSNPAFTVRQERYPLVWSYFVQHPWLGRGTGTWLAPQYQILDNYWLAFLISNGIIGVLLLATMHLIAFGAAMQARRRAATAEQKHLCIAVASTQIVPLLVAGTYDSLAFGTYALTVALTVGLCGAVWRLTHPSVDIRTAAPRWFSASPSAEYLRQYARR